MTSIIQFLEARITEDEQVATKAAAAVNTRWHYGERPAGEMWGSSDGMVTGSDDEGLWDCEGSSTLCAAPEVSDHMALHDPSRVLAECAAKRAIIAQHQAWPVLAKKAPEYSTSDDGLNGISYRVNQQMMWLTEQEYLKKFGEAPPTAPMIRTLAAVYKDHPDYQPEWEA